MAASSTRSVPPTFASSIAGRSDFGIPTSYIAPMWKTPSQPSTPRADRVGGREVALDELAAELAQRVRLLGRAHERHDIVAPLSQQAGHVPADEAGGTGHECLHGGTLTG